MNTSLHFPIFMQYKYNHINRIVESGGIGIEKNIWNTTNLQSDAYSLPYLQLVPAH